MQLLHVLKQVIFLSALATALPLLQRDAFAAPFSASDIIRIYANTATCASEPAPGECRTAAQAAPYINVSFQNFGVTDFASQAALLALMLYETGGFKYSINHYPGVPGQGTRNMQSPAFNLQYAQWLAAKVPQSGITPASVQTAQTTGPAAVLALVNDDQWGFASAAWFLQTQCSADVRAGLSSGLDAGWTAYLTQCISTQANDERTQLWKQALALRST